MCNVACLYENISVSFSKATGTEVVIFINCKKCKTFKLLTIPHDDIFFESNIENKGE